MMLPVSSLAYPSDIEFDPSLANGGLTVYIDSTSEMSVRGLCLKRFSREALLGNSTLSSLAFPIFVFGSFCSRSMLNLADRPGRIRLVRKSLRSGKASSRLNSGSGSGAFFCLRFRLRESLDGLFCTSVRVDPSACEGSLPFRRVKKEVIFRFGCDQVDGCTLLTTLEKMRAQWLPRAGQSIEVLQSNLEIQRVCRKNAS